MSIKEKIDLSYVVVKAFAKLLGISALQLIQEYDDSEFDGNIKSITPSKAASYIKQMSKQLGLTLEYVVQLCEKEYQNMLLNIDKSENKLLSDIQHAFYSVNFE